jgi:hypothetical protein
MKKIIATIVFAALSMASVYAQNTTFPSRGSGNGQGQGQGKQGKQGKKMGPQDGSGPIHTPGTGGGTGRGQRGPRR